MSDRIKDNFDRALMACPKEIKDNFDRAVKAFIEWAAAKYPAGYFDAKD